MPALAEVRRLRRYFMSALPASNEPIPGRQCDSCTLCCKVMAVTELQKTRGTWCKHCSPGKGCGIYATRPAECRSFFCGWLLDPRLGPEWKPSRSKIVLTPTPDGNGIAFAAILGFPMRGGAIRSMTPFWNGLRPQKLTMAR